MIIDMLKSHRERELASFHMPGHKNGRGFAGSALASEVFAFDTTELCDTDALIQPEGAILEAEQFTAKVYGAAHSFYLVGGATVGILAMIYAAFHRGDTVLVDRFCHQSVLHGCQLAGLRPVYVMPTESAIAGIPGTLTEEAISAAYGAHPEAKGVILTSPNYYGQAANLAAIAACVHAKGGLLLVDEAHGAHFPFSDAFPKTAMEQGADLSVVSLHKSMPAPNQTALLHMNSRFCTEDIRSALRMFQTSSPSYVFLAAMEQAVHFGAEQGKERTENLLRLLAPLNLPSLDDPFKLLPQWRRKGLSGDEVDAIFREKFGIYAELSTANGLLLMCSWFTNEEDIKRLKEALCYCDGLPDTAEPIEQPSLFGVVAATAAEMTLDAVREAEHTLVPIASAAGRICAAPVTAFPPCIPILVPGEIISREQVEAIIDWQAKGITLTGVDKGLCVVK